MQRDLRYWLLLAVVAAGAFCGIPRTRYYTLEMPHAAAAPSPAIDRHITVQRFRADRVLLDERILYREGTNPVGFYQYHRWANPPADLATDYVLHCLRDRGTYARISSYRDGSESDFTLRGHLFHFEEIDRGEDVFASVSLELELLATKTSASVWRGEWECTRPVTVRDVAGVVQEIHGCLEEAAAKLLDAMQQQVAKTR